jgi:hypothetical protein
VNPLFAEFAAVEGACLLAAAGLVSALGRLARSRGMTLTIVSPWFRLVLGWRRPTSRPNRGRDAAPLDVPGDPPAPRT